MMTGKRVTLKRSGRQRARLADLDSGRQLLVEAEQVALREGGAPDEARQRALRVPLECMEQFF